MDINNIINSLKTEYIGRNIKWYKTIDSTNAEAKRNTDMRDGTLFVADAQTNGRGRRGREWASDDDGVFMSLLLKPDIIPEDASKITLVAGIAATRAIGMDCGIKWPNDIVIGTKKVCGILTERFAYGQNSCIALGIGINLTTKSFPANLTAAGSVNLECDKTGLAREIAQIILEYAENPHDASVISEYRRFLFVIGKNITYAKNNIEYSAVVNDINAQCNLIVTRTDGTEDILSSGEISIKI